MAHQYVVGELYNGGKVNGQQVWTQPAGIGTLVYPQPQALSPENNMGYQQSVMSYPALYSAGCGHFFNIYEIFEVLSPSDGHQVALAACPQCGFIQEIFDPASSYWDYVETPLVIA